MDHLVAVYRMKTSISVTTSLLIIITTVQQLGGAHGNSPGSHTPGEFKGLPALYGPKLMGYMCTCTPIYIMYVLLGSVRVAM